MTKEARIYHEEKTMYEQNGNINKERDNLKRNHEEILELKNTKTEKNSKADLSKQQNQ